MTQANAGRLAEIWNTKYGEAVAAAKGRVRNTTLAEDLAMQAFERLGEALERRHVPDPENLLFVILHGLVVDHLRRVDSAPEVVPLDDYQDRLKSIPYVAPDRDFAPTFDRAVRSLRERERDVFILTELRGLTFREAGDVLGMSHVHARRLDKAARDYVRKELAA